MILWLRQDVDKSPDAGASSLPCSDSRSCPNRLARIELAKAKLKNLPPRSKECLAPDWTLGGDCAMDSSEAGTTFCTDKVESCSSALVRRAKHAKPSSSTYPLD